MAVDPKTLGIPASARPKNDPRAIDGLAGLESAHGAIQGGIDSIYKLSYELSAGNVLKGFDLPTIGSQIFDGNNSASKFIKQFDPGNKGGAVGFGLSIVDKINSALDEEKLFKDLLGPKIACLAGSFFDINSIIPTLTVNFPDLEGMLNSKLQEIQNSITSELDNALKPIQNALSDIADAGQKVNDLIGKIGACASAT
jgi:hypothetical protein